MQWAPRKYVNFLVKYYVNGGQSLLIVIGP